MVKVNKWNFVQIPSTNWEEIRSEYSNLIEKGIELQPMIGLIDYILGSELKNRLFAFVSVKTLVVSIYDKIEFRKENLKIEYDILNQKWFFEYYPRPDKPVQFEREYNKELGIEKFKQFIEFIKW